MGLHKNCGPPPLTVNCHISNMREFEEPSFSGDFFVYDTLPHLREKNEKVYKLVFILRLILTVLKC